MIFHNEWVKKVRQRGFFPQNRKTFFHTNIEIKIKDTGLRYDF